ncbi:uncharacterized protein B0I36DRAFT_113275 [Microdochium trichocladiopsis]|uniref:Uncharacterized protein n=1 Tax=Microdochium trichocladiopsis TaxID=1682393 RepID=A0A9P9BTR3_9PEZI|nr:uncharacterized protein B0I36DRAFT_113275 [Microdochium trichocladiopsis]KAH7030724.1 hypothetical protein B0I36DRAFT_113275 [Microdochium trichocladiopsis]
MAAATSQPLACVPVVQVAQYLKAGTCSRTTMQRRVGPKTRRQATLTLPRQRYSYLHQGCTCLPAPRCVLLLLLPSFLLRSLLPLLHAPRLPSSLSSSSFRPPTLTPFGVLSVLSFPAAPRSFITNSVCSYQQPRRFSSSILQNNNNNQQQHGTAVSVPGITIQKDDRKTPSPVLSATPLPARTLLLVLLISTTTLYSPP